MRYPVAAMLMAMASSASMAVAQGLPPVVTRTSPVRIWVDQIGYPTDAPKLAIVASDSPLPDDLQIELRTDKGNLPVWKSSSSTLRRFKDGQKDNESGEYVARLDFSDFRAPGRYYFALKGPDAVRSYRFNVAEHALRASGLAAWKAYYVSQAEGELPAK